MILSLALILFTSTAQGAVLENLSLNTSPPNHDFALCAMQAANAELIHSHGTVKLLNSELEIPLAQARQTSREGALRFYVIEPNSRLQIFRLIFRAAGDGRWKMVSTPGDKPYAFAAAAESRARLVADDDYFYIGEVDTAGCR